MSKLFNGTLYFVQVAFNVQAPPATTYVVSTADILTAIDYATRAVIPISLYASQYGKASVRVHQQLITYNAQVATATISDSDVRTIVKDVAATLPADACVVVLLPPAIDNSSHSRAQGTGGYHQSSVVPYINSYINNDQQNTPTLTVQDITFRYAGALSHEIAEMVCDPYGGGPEVCDPCGPNYVSTYLNYFDAGGNYITTTQTPPYSPTLGFTFSFYINGIVKPPFATNAAAPASACTYAPVSVSAAPLGVVANGLCCSAFYSPDDDYRHAIVGTATGSVTETFFHAKKGRGTATLATIPGLTDVCGFYTPDDDYRHVIGIGANGAITEHFYHPKKGQGTAVIATIANASRICGFYSDDDGYRHAIVSTSGGQVFEVYFHPKHGSGTAPLGTFNGVVDIGAFYSDDDKYRHVIVGLANGDVIEIYFSPKSGISQTLIGNVGGIARISAYYIHNDRDIYDRRVQVATGTGEVWELRYNPKATTLPVRILTTGPLQDVAGFHSADDRVRHAVCLLGSGSLQELYFDV